MRCCGCGYAGSSGIEGRSDERRKGRRSGMAVNVNVNVDVIVNRRDPRVRRKLEY